MSPLFFKRASDEMLGSRLASGEAAAFDELYRRYANRLAAYGAHLLGDAGLGDDVAQATMLKAYGALREGRVPNKMKPWLFRIAHNVAIDLVVRRRELPSAELPEPLTGDREPYAGTLIAALATLPDRQRRAYVLREVHGLRIDETAAELGLTTAQVEQALFAARNRLAEQLVFGDRLNCVTVQRLASGPLDTEERRALKTHLRTCTACRQTLGMRGRALSVFPAGMSLEWLPRLGAGLLGGGAPAVAKVGAVVATATIAAGGTVAVETVRSHAHRPVVPHFAAKATPVAEIEPAARVDGAVLPVARPAAVPVVVELHRRTGSGSGSGSGSNDRRGKDAAEHRVGSSKPTRRGERSGRREPGGNRSTRTHSDGDHSGRSGSTSSVRSSGSGSGSGSGERHDGSSSGRDGGTVGTTSGGDGRSGGSGTSGSGDGDRHDGGGGGGTSTSTSTSTATSGDGHHDGGEAATTTSRSGDGDHATTTTESDRRHGDETRTTTTTPTTTATPPTTTDPVTTTTTTTTTDSGGGGGGTDGGGGGGGTDGGGGGGTESGGSGGSGSTDGHGGDVADLQPVDSPTG